MGVMSALVEDFDVAVAVRARWRRGNRTASAEIEKFDIYMYMFEGRDSQRNAC